MLVIEGWDHVRPLSKHETSTRIALASLEELGSPQPTDRRPTHSSLSGRVRAPMLAPGSQGYPGVLIEYVRSEGLAALHLRWRNAFAGDLCWPCPTSVLLVCDRARVALASAGWNAWTSPGISNRTNLVICSIHPTSVTIANRSQRRKCANPTSVLRDGAGINAGEVRGSFVVDPHFVMVQQPFSTSVSYRFVVGLRDMSMAREGRDIVGKSWQFLDHDEPRSVSHLHSRGVR